MARVMTEEDVAAFERKAEQVPVAEAEPVTPEVAEAEDDERAVAEVVQGPRWLVRAPLPPTRIDTQALLLEAVRAGNIDVLERAVALAERVQAQTAKEAWHLAMAEFQAQCPEISRNRWNDWTKSRYASLGHMIRMTRPVLAPLGLTVTFGGEILENPPRAVAWPIVTHCLGHVEIGAKVIIPIDQGSTNERGNVKGANAAQRVGIAKQYARRYAYQDALGLNAEDDTDGEVGERQPGAAVDQAAGAVREKIIDPGAITPNQVKRLHAIATGKGWTDAELALFLKQEGIESSAAIPRARYDVIVDDGIRSDVVLAAVRKAMAEARG